MYKINEKQFNEMPQELKILYEKLPNHSSEEVVEKFPDTKTGAVKTKVDNGANQPINLGGGLTKERPADSGSASRFFYVAKASKAERNKGLEGFEEKEAPASARSKPADGRQNALGEPRANHHPTVKPIKLMQYLCRLITPKDGTCLDPYMGSGSTGIACKLEGFNFIGIERKEDYYKIAEARIEVYKKEQTLL